MNLPPDKARLLRQYDNEKKWELICDQVSNWLSCFYFLFAHLYASTECRSEKYLLQSNAVQYGLYKIYIWFTFAYLLKDYL